MNRTNALVTVALMIIAGCARHDQNPVAPAQSPAALQKPGEAKSSLDLIEDDYAAGLLDRDNASRYRQYAVSAPGKLPAKYRSAAIGKDATLSMVQIAREWDQLSADEIARYVDADEPIDCAGSYRIERLGIALFERIDGHDFTAIEGMPLLALAGVLRGAGFAVP